MKEICEQFSSGNFTSCYEYFSPYIEWTIVGDTSLRGKAKVIEQCDKMIIEMGGSKLENIHTIAANDHAIVEGFCNYTDASNQRAQVLYCDIYRFSDTQITSITTYCIDRKL